jgi:hypothetical protein
LFTPTDPNLRPGSKGLDGDGVWSVSQASGFKE